MKHKIFILIPVIFIIIGCHGDYYDLGDGYIYIEKSIGLKTGDHGQFKTVIYPYIKEYENSDRFIYVLQQPDTSYINEEIEFDRTYLNGEKVDSLRKISEEMQNIKELYWIIDKQKNNVYGPLSNREYKDKCDSLSISLSL